MGKALRKQQLRLVRRRLAFGPLEKHRGYRKPGSMNAHKSHPIGKGR